jgi:hypothetical protein
LPLRLPVALVVGRCLFYAVILNEVKDPRISSLPSPFGTGSFRSH